MEKQKVWSGAKRITKGVMGASCLAGALIFAQGASHWMHLSTATGLGLSAYDLLKSAVMPNREAEQ